MGELREFAEKIAGVLDEVQHRDGIRPKDIQKLFHDTINFYPGVPGAECRDTAAFVSLSSSAHKEKHKGHLTCRKAIEKVVQHMQGSCSPRVTRNAVLVVDSWDAQAVSEWIYNLNRIESEVHFEIYLVAAGRISPIRI